MVVAFKRLNNKFRIRYGRSVKRTYKAWGIVLIKGTSRNLQTERINFDFEQGILCTGGLEAFMLEFALLKIQGCSFLAGYLY